MQEIYTKAVKIGSKRLQNPKNNPTENGGLAGWGVYSAGDTKYQFRTFHEILDLKPPKNTIDAECVNGVWYWIVKVKPFELQNGKFYKISFSIGNEGNISIGKFLRQDASNFYWEEPRYKRWKQYETLDRGYTIKSFERIRVATSDDVQLLEKLKERTEQ